MTARLFGGQGRTTRSPHTLFDFRACDNAVDSRITVGGGANGTRINRSNNLVTKVCPRITQDASGVLGVLMESGRTNLLVHSSDFTDAAWLGALTKATGAAVAPDGTTTATKLIAPAVFQAQSIYQEPAASGSAAYTRSVFAKADGLDYIYLQQFDGAVNTGAYFNVATGSVGTVASGLTAKIEAYSGGWYRCSVTNTTGPSATYERCQIAVVASDGSSQFYTGDDVSGVLVWGAQLAAGSTLTSYIITAGSAVTRTTDTLTVADLASIGLSGTSWAFMVEFIAGPEVSAPMGVASMTIVGSGAYQGFYTYANLLVCEAQNAGSRYSETYTGITAGTRVKALFGYDPVAGFISACNGVVRTTQTHPGQVPIAADSFRVGELGGIGSYPANGHIFARTNTWGRVLTPVEALEETLPTVEPEAGPVWVFDPTRNDLYVDSRITVSGGANAWRVNGAGVAAQKTAPRITRDPGATAAKGVVVNAARTLLDISSDDFDGWGAGDTGGGFAGGSVTAPDGSNTAKRWTWPTSTGDASRGQKTLTGLDASGGATDGIWLRAVSGSFNAYLQMTDYTTNSAFSPQLTVDTTWRYFEFSTSALANTGYVGCGFAFSTGVVLGTTQMEMWHPALALGTAPIGQHGYAETTGAGSVVRTADSLVVSDLSTIGWGASGGTLAVRFECSNTQASDHMVACLAGGGASEQIRLNVYGGALYAEAIVASAGVASLNLGAVQAGSNYAAFRFAANDFAASLNGAAVVTDTSGAMPACTAMGIGCVPSAPGAELGGIVARVAYYNHLKADAALRGVL